MTTQIDVDEIWRVLGPFRRYTIMQIVYAFFITVYMAGFPVLVYVFVGYTPTHKCRKLSDVYFNSWVEEHNANYSAVSYEPCHTVLSTNGSNNTNTINVPCIEGYEYDLEVDTFVTEWNLVCDKAGLGELTQTIWTAGQAAGCLIFPSIADRYGRKPLTVVSMILLTCLGIAASFGNYITYVILRFLAGAFSQGYGITIYVLVVEQLPVENRRFVSSLGALSWGINVVVVSGIAYFMRNVNWRYVQMASGLVGVPCIVAYWILDESVRWLIANNKITQAKTVIKRVAKFNKVNLDKVLPILESTPKMNSLMESKTTTIQNGNSQQNENIITILQHKPLLKTTAIMSFAWITNSLVYYGLILTSTQMAGDRHLNFFLNVGVEIPAMFSFIYLIKKLPRKHVSVIFHSIAGFALIISVILEYLKDKNSHFETASVVFSFIGKFGITGSFSAIFLWTPELYPTNLRNIGLGLGGVVARIGGMLAPYSSMLARHISWGPGVIFGACCIIATFLQLLLPETSGKVLPQTVQELKEWDKQKKAEKQRIAQ